MMSWAIPAHHGGILETAPGPASIVDTGPGAEDQWIRIVFRTTVVPGTSGLTMLLVTTPVPAVSPRIVIVYEVDPPGDGAVLVTTRSPAGTVPTGSCAPPVPRSFSAPIR